MLSIELFQMKLDKFCLTWKLFDMILELTIFLTWI